ncbi:MAG: cobyric acid synthase [Deltaproteobacteria bacterium]|nr:cobyric acid synthase [Deltaproteobacteria bacterium]
MAKATAFCRIFKRRGHNVAPFKAQNMSNNSYVTVEGGEIGRAQVAQAEAAGVLPSVHMNPILIKPSTDIGAQIILHGKVFGHMDAMDYHRIKPELRKAVMESYNKLSDEYDCIVMEGAGSCCEMNLKDTDLVNLPMAKAVDAPCILVADIDRGGVFAQIIGTYNLMTRREKELVPGFLINKFRGDPRLFSSGMEYIEKKTGKPVLGLVPYYHDILIDSEDGVTVQEDNRIVRPLGAKTVNIAVIRFPAISNFTDLEILDRESDVIVNYLFNPTELADEYDCIILPGTKNVMEDAEWLSRRGWKKAINGFAKRGKQILGICGGYQIMGKAIRDPLCVESDKGSVKGLGLLPVETILEEEKVVRKVTGSCLLDNTRVKGYEIHMGRSRITNVAAEPLLRMHEPGRRNGWTDGCQIDDGKLWGTYLHGIFDSPGFRGNFLNSIRIKKGLKYRKIS